MNEHSDDVIGCSAAETSGSEWLHAGLESAA